MKQLFTFFMLIICSFNLLAMQPQKDCHNASASQKLSQFGLFHFQRDLVSLKEVQDLLKQGANPNTPSYDYKTPLLVYALAFQKEDMAQVLLEAGASVDEAFKSIASGSCYHFAQVLEELVGRGANVNQIVRDEMTALMVSTTRDMGRTEDLMQLGADPNIINKKDGDTALIMAVKNRKAFSVLALVTRKRTDRAMKNNDGNTAFDIAQGNDHIVRLFERAADKEDML